MKLIGKKMNSNFPFKITIQRVEEVSFYSKKNELLYSFTGNEKQKQEFLNGEQLHSIKKIVIYQFIRELRTNPGIKYLLSKIFVMSHIKHLGLGVISSISYVKLLIFTVLAFL